MAQSLKKNSCRIMATAGAVIIAGLLSACTTLGPAAVRNGRLAYNEAINATNNQQMLMAVVQNRYGESVSLLAVASITANVRFSTSANAQVGVGDSDNYAGNLVPLSVGAVYEENPTISYVPAAGAEYARRLAAPVPLLVLAELTGTLADPAYIYRNLVSSVNGIKNPDFLFDPASRDSRFDRFVSIMTELTRTQCLHWIKDPQQSSAFSIVIERCTANYSAEIRELLDLLGLPTPKDSDSLLVLSVSLALDGRDSGGIGITTRSIASLAEILSAAVDVPEDDLRNNVASSYPQSGYAGQGLHIGYSTEKPLHAYVAVRFRGGWFFIDESDQVTKRFFRLLVALWSDSVAESVVQGPSTPVLTVPVSR